MEGLARLKGLLRMQVLPMRDKRHALYCKFIACAHHVSPGSNNVAQPVPQHLSAGLLGGVRTSNRRCLIAIIESI